MLKERFWSKVAVKTETECWNWQANKNNKGYGMFSVNSYVGKKLAHRLSYEDANGKIPEGLHILHSCDNPSCVNPKHLFAGTRKDNMVDAAKKGRVGGMRVSDASVISLLRDYIGGMLREDIAAKYGISILSVSDFTTGKSRAWLHGNHGCPTLQELKDARRLKHKAILTEDKVREIKALIASGMQGKDIAERFGVHRATISDIRQGKTWGDI